MKKIKCNNPKCQKEFVPKTKLNRFCSRECNVAVNGKVSRRKEKFPVRPGCWWADLPSNDHWDRSGGIDSINVRRYNKSWS